MLRPADAPRYGELNVNTASRIGLPQPTQTPRLWLRRKMIAALALNADDDVVEFTTGPGPAAAIMPDQRVGSYTLIARDVAAERNSGAASRAFHLAAEVATVLMHEGVLSMRNWAGKRATVRDAARLLRSGGRYAIHELCLTPDDLFGDEATEAAYALARQALGIGAHPLTATNWEMLLRAEGFEIVHRFTGPLWCSQPDRSCGSAVGGTELSRNRRVHLLTACPQLAAIGLVARKRSSGWAFSR